MTAEQSSENQEQESKDKEYNFAQLRQKLETFSREKDQYAQKNQELQNKLSEFEQRFNQLNQKASEPEDDDEDDDYYVDKKKFEKSLKKVKEELKQDFTKAAEKKTQEALEQERQNNFLNTNKDFYDTLSHENIQQFAEKYPDLADDLSKLPDNFHRQKLLYRQIKHFGIGKKEEESVQSKVDANKRNPLNLSNTGNAPYAGVGDFSAAGQKTAYEKMQELKQRMRLG